MKTGNFIILGLLTLLLANCTAGKPGTNFVAPQIQTVQYGEQLIAEEQYEQAEEVFTALLEKEPSNPQLHYYLGLSLSNTGKIEQALASYEKATQLDSKFIEAVINKGLLYLDSGQIDKAIEALSAAVELEPDAADTHYNLGIALLEKEQFDGAIIHLQQAATIDPVDSDTIVALGDVALAQKNYENALNQYGKASQISPDNIDAILGAVEALIALEQSDNATTKMLELTKIEGVDIELITSGGLILAKAKLLDGAAIIYNAAIELDADYVKTYILLGNLLARQGNFEEAAKNYTEYLNRAPKGTDAEVATKRLEVCKAQLNK